MTYIKEFIQALDKEIDALKKGKGGGIIKVFNGRFLREMSGQYVYLFNLENFLIALEDSPSEARFYGCSNYAKNKCSYTRSISSVAKRSPKS